jgi:phosphoglycolate phosphatase
MLVANNVTSQITSEFAPMLKYRLVIFDSDGTLADTLPWMRSVFNEIGAAHGIRRIEEREHEHLRDLHGHALLKALKLPLWKLPRVTHAFRARMADESVNFALFPGIGQTLRSLSTRGVLLAVVSSNSRANVERVLGHDNAELISRYECGVSLFGKAVKIRAVIRAMKVAPAKAIYVGDEIRDAEASRKAGVAFGAVAWGQCSRNALLSQRPQEFFHTVEELKLLACASD